MKITKRESLAQERIEELKRLAARLENIPYQEGLELARELRQGLAKYEYCIKQEWYIDLLMRLGIFYGQSSMHEEAQRYFSMVLANADENSMQDIILRAKSNLAICEAQLGNYHEAVDIWLNLLKGKPSPFIHQNLLNNISVGYGVLGDYHKSIDYGFQALELALKGEDKSQQLSPLMNLSTAYEKLGDFGKAKNYVEQAIYWAKKTGNKRRECECMNNLSLILNQMGLRKEALEKAEECLRMRNEYFSEMDHSTTYNNIGYILECSHEYEKALEYYAKALELSRDIGNKTYRINTLLNISSIYLIQGRIEDAGQHLDKLEPELLELNVKDLLLRYYEQMGEVCRKQADFETALEYQIKRNDILNQLYLDQMGNSINKSEADYFQKRIEEQAQLYREQNLELKHKNRIIIKNSRELNRSNQSLRDTVETLNWAVSVISHDVRAPLANFNKILAMLLNHEIDPGESEEILHSMLKSSMNVFKLVDEILDGIRLQRRKLDENTNIQMQDIVPYLSQIYLIYQPIAQQKLIKLDFDFEKPEIFATVDGDLLKIVVRNLLNNAIKFTRERGTITLKVRINPDEINITIEDNGIGMHKKELKALMKRNNQLSGTRTDSMGIGLGWILCRDSLKKMKGKMHIDSQWGKGTTISISLPRS